MIKGKRICITGMAGSIGSELAKQLAKENKLFGLDINEGKLFSLREELRQKGYWVYSRTGDIRNKETVFDVFSDFKPQIIFHAAALKHVTPNEEYPDEAFSTNIDGTRNVVREAKQWECLEKLIFVSTDKVVNAKNMMGITKLCAEAFVKLQGEKFAAVRFGNVMGSSGSLFEIWEKQIANNEPITVTDERMERYFMTTEEACELVIAAIEKAKGGEVMVMKMGKKVNILQLAKRLVEELKYEPGIKMIGIRPGETLSEQLMTADEEKIAVEEGNFYIIK